MTQLEILQAARLHYQTKLAEVDRLIAEESGQATPAVEKSVSIAKPGKRGKFSAATRAKMAEAQRKRWAKLNGETPAEAVAKGSGNKRKLSVAGRKAIADATKRRWAAFRAAQGKAKAA